MDTKYTGTRAEEDKEILKRQTNLGEGTSKAVPLGLARGASSKGGAAPPSDSSDNEDADEDDEMGEASDSENEMRDSDTDAESTNNRRKSKSKPRKTKRKRDDLQEEILDEAPRMLIPRMND